MIKVNQDDYAYSASRVRAREIKMLDGSRFNRMLEAASPEEAFKVLTEAEYGLGIEKTGGFYSFEELLAEEMKKTYMLLLEMAPEIEVVKAFQRRHDSFNIKVLLKSELQNIDPPSILLDTGTFEKDEIVRIIRERDYKELTQIMQDAVAEVYDVFSRMHDPQAIDLILDKASHKQFIRDLRNIDNTFLHEIAEIITDISNIKMYIRAQSIGREKRFLEKILLAGGKVSTDYYIKNSGKPDEVFIDGLRDTKYFDVVKKGFEIYSEKSNISVPEKLLDDFFMEFLQRAKLITIGVEPFIAYLFAKETEIKNVRIIMTGKINNLPVDMIRERLRLVYV